MTEHIQQIIEKIRQKSLALHTQLNEEREKNKEFQAEIAVLKENQQSQKQKEDEHLSEIASLKMELEATKGQIVENSRPIGKKDDEIDELVKEIEHCISQLKK